MSAAAVYRCLDNARLSEYAERREVLESRWRAGMAQYKLALGGVELHGISFYDGGWSIRGYVMKDWEDLQHGWRRDGRSLNAVPAKRTEDGKALARELRSLDLPGNKYPGVPDVLHTPTVNGQGYMVFPRTELLGDQWWLTLSMAPDDSRNGIDPQLWTPAKLSEYHAAKEASGE